MKVRANAALGPAAELLLAAKNAKMFDHPRVSALT
jgi:hypothetical protein